MKKLITSILILCSVPIVIAVAEELDKRIFAPSGNLILDAKLGSYIKAKQPLRVDKIENLAGTSSPPGMIPIGGMVIVMPTNTSGVPIPGAWQPPANCTTIVDGFMRAGYNGSTCTVPAKCKDCIIPAGTALPNMYASYPRGGNTSGVTGGANMENTNVSISNHPSHTHDVTSSVTVASAVLPSHSHTNTLTYNVDHNHPNTTFDASSNFVSGHSHTVSSMYAGITYGTNNAVLLSMATNSTETFDFNRQISANVTKDCPVCDIWVNPAVASIFSTPSPSNPAVVVKGDTGGVVGNLTAPQTTVGFQYTDIDRPMSSGEVGTGCNPNTNPNCPVTVTLQNWEVTSTPSTLSHQNLVSNPDVNNEPKYITVVWVIRVK